MIVEERLTGTNLIKRYSDQGLVIRQVETGAEYGEAIDLDTATYTYVETDIPIEEEDLTDAEALDILLGGDGNEQK